jgi:hypothetical protein
MLQISAFTNGTFVTSLDVQKAMYENEERGSSLWLDVYRPKDSEVLLYNRDVRDIPPTSNSFLFTLSSFKTVKRLMVTRNDDLKMGNLIADATILFADDLIITIRNRGFKFNELVDYIMKSNSGRMPENPLGLYDAFGPTYFAMFKNDLKEGRSIDMFSEQNSKYAEDVAIFNDTSWTLREVTIPIAPLIAKCGDSMVMTVTALPITDDKSVAMRIPTGTTSSARLDEMVRKTVQTVRQIPVLSCTKGPEQGAVFKLDKSPIRIGRDATNDIPLNVNGVSRRHALISIEGDRVLLTDLGSTNGTYVNAARIQQVVLKPGDEVFLGNAVFKFEYR